VFLELIALAVIFGLWFLSGFQLDPAESVSPDPLWGYLAAVGGVGVLAGAAAAVAARVRAVVTVVGQAVVVGLVCVVVFGGVALQSHQDQRCRDVPSAAGCRGSGGISSGRNQ
jgi:intracellular septation protein A